ncbi:hypothetical protein [Marinibacterium sp. SX1]|uniref:hypothetical protein n=1 Tax=Marinibacterium sp. SX1 TaxID=3388424 RepID=UPI003D17C927
MAEILAREGRAGPHEVIARTISQLEKTSTGISLAKVMAHLIHKRHPWPESDKPYAQAL